MDDHTYVIVTTTVGEEKLAVKLAELITAARFAACVQFWPIRSVYWWQGKVESSAEFILQCKTRTDLASVLQEFIRTHHSYEVPEIIVTPIIQGHPPYLNWIEQETANGGRG